MNRDLNGEVEPSGYLGEKHSSWKETVHAKALRQGRYVLMASVIRIYMEIIHCIKLNKKETDMIEGLENRA